MILLKNDDSSKVGRAPSGEYRVVVKLMNCVLLSMNFVSKLMNFGLTLMSFGLKLMNFGLKLMIFVLKTDRYIVPNVIGSVFNERILISY